MFKILVGFLVAIFSTAALAGPLHDAARQGDVGTVHEIIARGADPNEKAQNGETPLILAVLGGHEEVARALIESGADIHARNAGGFTPLHAAAYAGDVAIAQLLLAKDAQVDDQMNKAGVTPLSVAAEEDRPEVTRVLVEHGADLEASEQNGYTPLTRALWRGHGTIAALLQKSGATCQPIEVLEEPAYSQCVAGQH